VSEPGLFVFAPTRGHRIRRGRFLVGVVSERRGQTKAPTASPLVADGPTLDR
jgi:hypothetical protein